jgi:hypothetical protein
MPLHHLNHIADEETTTPKAKFECFLQQKSALCVFIYKPYLNEINHLRERGGETAYFFRKD